MQRILPVLDAITISSSLFLIYGDIRNWIALITPLWDPNIIATALLWWVLFPLSIIVRICRFSDQRWQLFADRIVISVYALNFANGPLTVSGLYLSGYEIDPMKAMEFACPRSLTPLSIFLVGGLLLIVSMSIMLVKGTIMRVLLSVMVLPMFLRPQIYVVPLSALGCMWRQQLTSHLAIQKEPGSTKHKLHSLGGFAPSHEESRKVQKEITKPSCPKPTELRK